MNKIKLNITPVTRDSYDCMTGIMATLAEYYHKEYMPLLLSHWSVSFEPRGLLGHSVKRMEEYTSEACPLFSLIKKYMGLDLGKECHGTINELLPEFIHELREKRPVILRLKERDFPWAEHSYAAHYSLLTGLDDENLIFLDPYISDKSHKVPLSSLAHTEAGCFFIRSSDYYRRSQREILTDLTETAKAQFLPLENFVNEFASLKNLKEETEGYGDYDIPLFQEIKFLYEGRQNTALLFSWLGNQYKWEEGPSFAEEMQSIAALWFKICIFLMKTRHKKDQEAGLNKITDRLREIMTKEKELYGNLKEAVKQLPLPELTLV